ncbi:MAG: YHS domain-containing protein [Planctomycetes bacterium]|nr:YHS domain-containing protein [Planctomycetota bacterium]
MAAGLALLAAGCRSEPKAPPAPGAEKAGAPGPGAAAPSQLAQKLCPVMGGPVNPDIFVDYQGRRIYFCCDMCPATFKKDPEKYLKKLDEQMKGGS